MENDFKADARRWGRLWNLRGMQALDDMLAKTSGRYCYGDTLTMADAFVFPQAWLAKKKFEVELNDYWHIKQAYDNLKDIPSFKDAHAINQPDFPDDLV